MTPALIEAADRMRSGEFSDACKAQAEKYHVKRFADAKGKP